MKLQSGIKQHLQQSVHNKKIDVCYILIEDIDFSPKYYNIVVRAKAQEKNIEKECRFSSLKASVGTSIFEMLNKQFQL